MKLLIRACFMVCLTAVAFFKSVASDSTSIKLVFDKQRISDTEVLLTIKAKVNDGTKFYTLQKGERDALYSSITFDSSAKKYL